MTRLRTLLLGPPLATRSEATDCIGALRGIVVSAPWHLDEDDREPDAPLSAKS